MDVEGRTAIVSGGASGLGEASARMLVENGANVAIIDIDAERGGAMAAELGKACIYCQADITAETDVRQAVALTADTFGAVHIALNCAGIVGPAKALSKKGTISFEHFSRVIQINLTGTLALVVHAADKMRANTPNADGETGVVINTASVAAFEGQIGQVAYSASKAGVVGMTLPLAREFADYGIRVVTIAPGLFETPMLAGLPPAVNEALIKMVPFPKRLGRPAEYASFVNQIITNPALNGETIRLDHAIRMAAK